MSGGSPVPFNTGAGISPINPAAPSSTSAAGTPNPQNPPAPPAFTGETFQPTVRVMRL